MKLQITWRDGFFLFIILACVPGCGKSGPDIAFVSGTVTHAGQPVGNVEVNFYPKAGRPSVGRTDAEGNYTLNYNQERKGALFGSHRVSFKFLPRNPIDQPSKEISTILNKYGDPKNSPLIVEVKENNQVIPLTLD